jgi:hypothetical protein
MTVVGAVTLGIALLGAILGIINTCLQYDKRRVKLRVIPKIAYLMLSRSDKLGAPQLCIEIINLSDFPVTISDVGLTSGNVNKAKRITLIEPLIYDGKRWPRRLESHESVTVYFEKGFGPDEPDYLIMKKAYAKTDCGIARYGNSLALKSYLSVLRKHMKENSLHE